MLLNGKDYSKEIKENIKKTIEDNHLSPSLLIISVGKDKASEIYIRNKNKSCQEVGIRCIIDKYDEDVKEEELITKIKVANSDPTINGIMVQLPIPKHLNATKIINTISSEKDVDGLTYVNAGKLKENAADLIPCTALGIVMLMKRNGISISGKHCVIIGRSNIVGKPLADLMLNEDATVTVCHSKTKNLKEICRTADILVAAVGKQKFITRDYLKDGAVVIDVGINRDENGKVVGDVDFENVKDICSFITPVPGGVGPMTVAMLLNNVIKK